MAEYKCFCCGVVIPEARVEFLKESNIDPINFTCVKHSQTTKIKGIYTGEAGTSDLILCDKIYNDSVRSVFKSAAEEPDHSDDVD